jgi:hypothetical protein
MRRQQERMENRHGSGHRAPESGADDDPLIQEVVAEARAFVESRPVPDLTARVMGAVEAPGAEQPSAVREVVAWLWTLRLVQFRVRPAYALAAAFLLVVVAVMAGSAPRAPEDTIAGPPATVFVQFRLDHPEAAHVQLAGSFTNWEQPYDLRQAAPGVWTITIPLAPGVHDYSFIVDGARWVADPYAPAVDDGFGGINSRLSLVLPEGPRS